MVIKAKSLLNFFLPGSVYEMCLFYFLAYPDEVFMKSINSNKLALKN